MTDRDILTKARQMTIVSHRERQFMQYLGSGGWANAANLPPGRK